MARDKAYLPPFGLGQIVVFCGSDGYPEFYVVPVWPGGPLRSAGRVRIRICNPAHWAGPDELVVKEGELFGYRTRDGARLAGYAAIVNLRNKWDVIDLDLHPDAPGTSALYAQWFRAVEDVAQSHQGYNEWGDIWGYPDCECPLCRAYRRMP